jgi:hypothetical protein
VTNSVFQQCSTGAWSWCEKKFFLEKKRKFREKKSRSPQMKMIQRQNFTRDEFCVSPVYRCLELTQKIFFG